MHKKEVVGAVVFAFWRQFFGRSPSNITLKIRSNQPIEHSRTHLLPSSGLPEAPTASQPNLRSKVPLFGVGQSPKILQRRQRQHRIRGQFSRLQGWCPNFAFPGTISSSWHQILPPFFVYICVWPFFFHFFSLVENSLFCVEILSI